MAAIRKSEEMAGNSTRVLIPVDFSPKGNLALKVGFELARRLSRKVTLLHASVIADPMIEPQFPDDFNGMDNENAEIEEMELTEEVHEIDEKSMKDLKTKLKRLQTSGDYPDIEFDTVIAPGMPEEVIAEYCANTPPTVIVMATRGRVKRHEELVGSVTAEVIDHCLAPTFTVPEDYTFAGFKDIVRICALCNFEDGDISAISNLMEMFGNPEVKIYLFPAVDKYKGAQLSANLQQLQERLAPEYPNSEFIVGTPENMKNLREEAEAMFASQSIQMILVPNRKRNPIARFFNPGLAHKILYEADIPMLAFPVK